MTSNYLHMSTSGNVHLEPTTSAKTFVLTVQKDTFQTKLCPTVLHVKLDTLPIPQEVLSAFPVHQGHSQKKWPPWTLQSVKPAQLANIIYGQARQSVLLARLPVVSTMKPSLPVHLLQIQNARQLCGVHLAPPLPVLHPVLRLVPVHLHPPLVHQVHLPPQDHLLHLVRQAHQAPPPLHHHHLHPHHHHLPRQVHLHHLHPHPLHQVHQVHQVHQAHQVLHLHQVHPPPRPPHPHPQAHLHLAHLAAHPALAVHLQAAAVTAAAAVALPLLHHLQSVHQAPTQTSRPKNHKSCL